ncbi:serine/threonine protein kinase [Actinocorallia herbida]|uniref:Serine/threonine protein kinase n=1 Tax=Actinocorallia herbida TaxID=58109 RepID=A0A3N1CVT4_9ACTN|nr:serine/threonine-protein kinase [Actinocorallia herbida]ROO85411.1 serine/threonine protein kinase [Actinocorallia herbida]
MAWHAETAPLTPEDPRALGGYRLHGRLGAGGQGVVYLGADGSGRHVAVKTLRAPSGIARERFAAEAEHVMRVPRFCIAAVLAADAYADPPYVVSEYVPGPSLAAAVRRRGPHTGGDLDRLAVATATALIAIHQADVVHLDFKPANIIVGADGPRVIDFGIARLRETITGGAARIGTPAYMAPEQAHGDVLPGPATDLWAWALTMVFAATGRDVFRGGSVRDILAKVGAGAPVPTALDRPLADAVAECLSADPRRRPTARRVLGLLTGLPGTLTDGQAMSQGADLASGSAGFAAMAEEALRRGRYALAIRYADQGLARADGQEALRLTRDEARCHRVRGLAERALREGDGLEDLELAYEIDPEDSEFTLTYARALDEDGHHDEAFALAPDDPGIAGAWVEALVERYRTDPGEVNDTQSGTALRLCPDDRRVVLMRAGVLARTDGGLPEASTLVSGDSDLSWRLASSLAQGRPSQIRAAARLAPSLATDAYSALLTDPLESEPTFAHLRGLWPDLPEEERQRLSDAVADRLATLVPSPSAPFDRDTLHAFSREVCTGMLDLGPPDGLRLRGRRVLAGVGIWIGVFAVVLVTAAFCSWIAVFFGVALKVGDGETTDADNTLFVAGLIGASVLSLVASLWFATFYLRRLRARGARTLTLHRANPPWAPYLRAHDTGSFDDPFLGDAHFD